MRKELRIIRFRKFSISGKLLKGLTIVGLFLFEAEKRGKHNNIDMPDM